MTKTRISIKKHRRHYELDTLNKNKVPVNPISLFRNWMDKAIDLKILEPNAVNLSTVDDKGKPSSRIVLLRGFDKNGFVFFTNYLSHKGQNLASNPYAAMTFFWAELEKQVRIEGRVQKISKAASDAYFRSRPRESKIGAWASHQSSKIESRDELIRIVENLTLEFKGRSVPRPDYWGGYCLKPDKIEFWQGRPNRLHDRILFERMKKEKWRISRLSP